jgi:hypothetical protein
MFGYKNFTGFSFIGKIGKFSVEFSAGVVEEVVLNITTGVAVNAAEIPENLNLQLPATEKIVETLGSKILQSHLIPLIAAATPNLLL